MMIDFSLVFNDVCNWFLLFVCNYYQNKCKLSQNSPFGRGNKDIVLYCIVFYCIVLYCIVLYCIVAKEFTFIEPKMFP